MNVLSRLLVILRWAALLSFLFGAVTPALAAKTYSDNGDGTVTDPTTGLTWMRCLMGQTWDGTTCTGAATSTFSFNQASGLTGSVVFAGQNDWRLPNIRELQTIVDRSSYPLTVDSAVFPSDWQRFLVSSTHGSNGPYAWTIEVSTGMAVEGDDWQAINQVLLVRGGQLLGLLDIARPSTDYVLNTDGTVLHTPTMLIWQRCAIGQNWNGATCTGTAGTYTWDQAKLLSSNLSGKTDWRLPTEEELSSLVDYTRHYPTTNANLFVNAPSSYRFWSNSPFVGNSAYAWQVYLNLGTAEGVSARTEYNGVRLVRAGRAFGPLMLTVNIAGVGQVTSSVMPGIDCGTLCTGGFNDGDLVTLNASPAANLISWGGACASAGTSATCTVTMDAAKSVTATFKDTPVASGLPTNLAFALQNKGSTSAPQSITLTNTGTAALAISGIATTGDFSVTNNCGGGLGVGGYCTLNVSFSPTVTGNRTGNLTITSDASGSPHTVNLSGSGQGAIADIISSNSSVILATPPSGFGIFFSNTSVGGNSSLTIALNNTGGDILNISGIAIGGDFASSTTCSSTLNPATSCTITVTFSPTVAGARSGTLIVNSDSANGTITLGLNGTGTAVPVVSLNPTTLGFSSQNVATTSAAQSITLTNSGGAPLNLTSFTATGDFAITGNCGGGLGAGGFCTINVTFTPSAGGARSGSIVIVSNAAGSPQTINLNGAGVAAVAGPPTSVSATAGAAQAMVSFVAPSGMGGSPITGYTVTSIPPGGIDSNAGSPALLHTITGLTNGTAYTFTVVATNGAGDSAASVSSNSVIPVQIGQAITFGLATTLIVGSTGTVSATGGASGNPITFSSTTPKICSVTGNTVTALAVGNCTVAANQAGDANFAAATQVTQNITVGQGTQSLSFSLGWNLLGNSLNQILSVVPTFADTAIVTTVWKWDVTVPGWQFYAPSMTPTELQTYATSKGYGVLSSINPGEGYWVNAKVAGSLGAQSGSAYTLTSADLVTGWNLVATSTDVTPSTFNISLSATPPSQGTIPINLTTLWAWDSTQSKWYFYAPGLEASGGLGAYTTGKGYLDFNATGKALGNGVGFWVNKP